MRKPAPPPSPTVSKPSQGTRPDFACSPSPACPACPSNILTSPEFKVRVGQKKGKGQGSSHIWYFGELCFLSWADVQGWLFLSWVFSGPFGSALTFLFPSFIFLSMFSLAFFCYNPNVFLTSRHGTLESQSAKHSPD